jgi:hypothetical protein
MTKVEGAGEVGVAVTERQRRMINHEIHEWAKPLKR